MLIWCETAFVTDKVAKYSFQFDVFASVIN